MAGDTFVAMPPFLARDEVKFRAFAISCVDAGRAGDVFRRKLPRVVKGSVAMGNVPQERSGTSSGKNVGNGKTNGAKSGFAAAVKTRKAGKATLSSPAKKHKNGTRARSNAYRPKVGEPFMNARQRDYFREKLLYWKSEILRENKETLAYLQADTAHLPDMSDRASTETVRSLELRARDRQRKLVSKIDAALCRIEDGSYGYCEETGEPINIKRLDARPIATLSIEAQERHEMRERVYRDD